MKIISKYKDYYDYLIGIFGEDSKLILDRRSGGKKIYPNDNEIVVVCIGNKRFEGIYKDKSFHFGKVLKQFHTENNIKHFYRYRNMWGRQYDDTKHIIYNWPYLKHTHEYILSKIPVNTTINSDYNCAIILFYVSIHSGELINEVKYPILKDINIASVLPARDCWILLTDFLSAQIKEPEVPIGSDNIRIQSHGFDLKTSFRPNIKI